MEEKKELTITLTGQRPVRINKEEWPIIAKASASEHDGEYDFQSNRRSEAQLIVRQRDGRAIVYGIYKYESQWQGEKSYNIRGGELLDAGADIPEAITRVGEWMERTRPQGLSNGGDGFGLLINECIADLPAVTI